MENEKKQEMALQPRHAGLAAQLAPRTFSLLPSSLGDALAMAKMIAESDFAPKDYRGKPSNVLIAIQMGADVGLKPMQALQNIAVINGRPSIWGDGAVALVQSKDVLERFFETIEGENDDRTATCVIKRKGWPDEIKRTFSIKDAKRAGLWGKAGPWSTYPDRMLQMRARSFALRDGASDVLMGLILAEEAGDYVDAEIVASEPIPVSPLSKLPDALQEKIGVAFEKLNLNPGLRTAKVTEYLKGADPEVEATALLEWCRDEFAKRAGRQRGEKKDDTNARVTQQQTKAAPVVDATVEPVKATETPAAADLNADLGF